MAKKKEKKKEDKVKSAVYDCIILNYFIIFILFFCVWKWMEKEIGEKTLH